jgi:hypothetical protein
VLTVISASSARAEAGAPPACASLKPFSAETHFLSTAGYLRWLEFQQNGAWISRVEAVAQVAGDATCATPSLLADVAK